jgi:Zn-finger nucleic acid-binding protein
MSLSCPNCRGTMEPLELDGHLGRKVSIDICHPCQAFWFDKYESLHVTDAFASFDQSPNWYAAASSRGLVSTALDVFTEWLGE